MSEPKADGRVASDLCDVLGPMVEAAGMVNVLNHGSGSCVYSEGCHGVTQEHLERFAELVRADERERICAAIKAEDDHCADGDYMLDSDDCIKVARGQWKRPDWGKGPNADLSGRTRSA